MKEEKKEKKEKKEKLTMRNLANSIETSNASIEGLDKKFNILGALWIGSWLGYLAYCLLIA
jgi:hypothetical protein